MLGAPDPLPADLDRRIKMVDTERSLVGAAMTATARRIEDIGDRRTKASRKLTEQLDRWSDRLSDLDEELNVLAGRRELVENGSTRPGETPERKNLACDVEELLGPRPGDRSRARAWDQAAAEVRTYRARWTLQTTTLRLAPLPTKKPRRRARRDLVRRTVSCDRTSLTLVGVRCRQNMVLGLIRTSDESSDHVSTPPRAAPTGPSKPANDRPRPTRYSPLEAGQTRFPHVSTAFISGPILRR